MLDLGNGNGGKSRSPSPRRGQRREADRSYSEGKSSSKRSRSRSRSPPRQRSPSPPPKRSGAKDRWLAKVPVDQEDFIHSIARTVRDHGSKYEENLMAKHRSNPDYAFMFDDNVRIVHATAVRTDSRHQLFMSISWLSTAGIAYQHHRQKSLTMR